MVVAAEKFNMSKKYILCRMHASQENIMKHMKIDFSKDASQ